MCMRILHDRPVSEHVYMWMHVLTLASIYRAIKHLLEVLKPYGQENGGPLKIDHVTFVEGRGNLILEYSSPGAEGTVAFMGSHLDVVPANPETWERNPFKLAVEVRTHSHSNWQWRYPDPRLCRETSCMGVAPLTVWAMWL